MTVAVTQGIDGSAGRMLILKYEEPSLAGNVSPVKRVKKL